MHNFDTSTGVLFIWVTFTYTKVIIQNKCTNNMIPLLLLKYDFWLVLDNSSASYS